MMRLILCIVCCMTAQAAWSQTAEWPPHIRAVLDNTRPLDNPRGSRLPLYLWPAMDPGDLDDTAAERLVAELDRRGVGLVSSWTPKNRDRSLARSLAVARAQKKLGLIVNVNATPCLYRFYTDDPSTAHVDSAGKPFWDDSFGQEKMGCPFTLDPRIPVIKEQVEWYVAAYAKAGIDIGFIFADWEVDGPIEVNRAWEASKRCVRCREHIPGIEDFTVFRQAVRDLRNAIQREVYAEPVLARFPHALVGNYAVNPHDGYRYWYDYFEQFVEGRPFKADGAARYRAWYDDFPGTGYTFAMPVVYPWNGIYSWYDFTVPDYRWFRAMLLEASSAGKSTPPGVPVITFVHWHTVPTPDNPKPDVPQMSPDAYRELLWHMLFRGTDTFFMWCGAADNPEEVRYLHEVYAAAQKHGEFLDKGTPISFDVPDRPGTVISGLFLRDRVLVRRTDFIANIAPEIITVKGKKLSIPSMPGECRIFRLPK